MLTTPESNDLWPTLGPAAVPITTAGFPELASTSRKSLADAFGTVEAPNRSRNIHVSECDSIDELAGEIDEELAARPPDYRPDYGAAIAHALNQQALLNAVVGGGQKTNKNGEQKQTYKKKKKGNTLLFTTNVRSYNTN